MAERVGPALRHEPAILLARLGREQRVLEPALGLVDVDVGRDDVIVANQDRRHLAVEQRARMGLQRVQPGELVVELRARLRVAVGRVHVADEDAAHRRLDVAALLEIRDRRAARGGFQPAHRPGRAGLRRSSCAGRARSRHSRAARWHRVGNASSVHLSSWRPTMSGRNSSSQRVSTCSRELMPLIL